jgi:16S rRNA (adenine1518-N6/adenine1519-N6)-dimethyltransferase
MVTTPRLSVRPKQSLGQNFLVDRNIVNNIIRELHITGDDVVVEIGPGTGALTSRLAERSGRLVIVEIDGRIIEDLRAAFQSPSVTILHQDFLATDLAALHRRYRRRVRIAGNIPYHLTSPILFKVFSEVRHVQDITIMVQREVARRIAATPGSKNYGILAVFAWTFGTPRILFDVSPNCFYPKPKVTSALVQIALGDGLPAGVDEETFRSVVRTAFGKRRKTLRNSLKYLPVPPEALSRLERDVHSLLERRPEQLTTEEFMAVTRSIQEETRAAHR